eukprot:s6542_g1.t1
MLPPGVFHGFTFGRNGILNMSQNTLQTLHADAFHGLTFDDDGILNISYNKLQVLHADAFHGLIFGYRGRGILDMSQNTLQDLPPKVFDGLKVDRLYLQNNALSQLHAETFQNFTFGKNGILDMSQNKLQVLHAETFRGLTFSWGGTLDISQNKLQDLPPKVFDSMGYILDLDLAHNELSTRLRLEGNRLRSLGDRPFWWLYRLEELNLEQNQLTDLDEDVFDGEYDDSVWDFDPVWIYYSLKRSLLELKLGGNRLTALPDGLFKGFRKLRNLQLQSNKLVRLPQRLNPKK